VIKCFGAGESEVEQMLPDLIRRGRDPLVGITVSGATISLRITTSGATVEECDARIQPTVDEIYRTLGTLVYGEGEVELDVATANLLRERGQTLATVEFGTAGLIAHWLAAASADGAPLAGSMVAASSDQIGPLLGLPSKSTPGSTFAAWIEQAARAVRTRFSASLGLAACADSVVAGDLNALRAAGKTSGGGPDLPRLWVGLDDGAKVISRSFVYAGPDALVAPRAAKQALNLVRLRLQAAL
jgi:nicotinamide-nucleotide amidase